MKKLFLSFLLINASLLPEEIELTVSAEHHAAMPLALFVFDDTDELADIARTLHKDLTFTQQFSVTTKQLPANASQKKRAQEIQALFPQGTPLALCINRASPTAIEWRLYDTAQKSMLEGKKYEKKGTVARGWGHAIADDIWKTLTGNKGFFSSKIAYCKEFRSKKGTVLKKIYIADFDGSYEELLVDERTVVVAPRWHADTNNPLLFFSKYTDKNMSLESINMKKKQKTTSNFDGVNMMPGFSRDGKSVIYSVSHGYKKTGSSCELYRYYKQSPAIPKVITGILEQCTNNGGTNLSASFIDDTHICFCSDAYTGSPQIYIQDLLTQAVTPITHGGYCTSPTYCPLTNTIVYHKMVSGTMQIYQYHCATKKHVQTTTSKGNKHEACYSPCGTMLLFAHEQGSGRSRIANLNLLTNAITYLSPANQQCSYPHWSPCYSIFPTLQG